MKAIDSRKARGKAIAAAKKKTGPETDWKAVFKKLDATKKRSR